MIDEGAAAMVRWFFSETAKGTTTSDRVAKANKKKLAGKQWTSRTALRLPDRAQLVNRRRRIRRSRESSSQQLPLPRWHRTARTRRPSGALAHPERIVRAVPPHGTDAAQDAQNMQ
jgi:hypothetical protein